MDLSVIVPLFNEENTIGELIEKLNGVSMPEYIKSIEIIVINDGSKDNSLLELKIIEGKYANVHIINRQRNLGKGACIKTGIANSKGNLIILQDADAELNPDDIPSLIETLQNKNKDMVNGTRFSRTYFIKGGSIMRSYGNMMFSTLGSIVGGVRITDITCGYKLFRRSLWERLYIKENGFAIDVEIFLKTIKNDKNCFAEVPVSYTPRKKKDGKKIRAKDSFIILRAILRYGLFTK